MFLDHGVVEKLIVTFTLEFPVPRTLRVWLQKLGGKMLRHCVSFCAAVRAVCMPLRGCGEPVTAPPPPNTYFPHSDGRYGASGWQHPPQSILRPPASSLLLREEHTIQYLRGKLRPRPCGKSRQSVLRLTAALKTSATSAKTPRQESFVLIPNCSFDCSPNKQ